MRRFATGILLVTAFFAGTMDARAGGGDAGIALRGLDRALAAGRLSPLDAHEHRQRVRLAQRVLRRLPAERRHSLAVVLAEVADQASTYDDPRALTLFTTLELNAKHLVHDRLPAPGHDVADGLGVVYRSVPGRGLRFHPLGSFGQLNKYVSAGQRRRATSLAYALLARAHAGRRELTWEYDFRAAGGDPPWTSGMAQAVAAQALARAGLVPEARLAFAAIPKRLVNERETGAWIRLYGFSDIAVLNAQLQAALSLADYARLARDERAALLATRLRRAALRALPAFDTGHWSRYALGGSEAPLGYHQYVTSLLWKLAQTTGNERWATQAAEFRDDGGGRPRSAAWPPEHRRCRYRATAFVTPRRSGSGSRSRRRSSSRSRASGSPDSSARACGRCSGIPGSAAPVATPSGSPPSTESETGPRLGSSRSSSRETRLRRRFARPPGTSVFSGAPRIARRPG